MVSHAVLNAHGLTPKQELFAQLLARGKSLSDAYREAYNSSGKYQTVNNSASRLWSNPMVRERVEVLLKQQTDNMMRDSVAIRRHVFSGLMAESINKESKASERISALLALGKIDMVGMFREIHGVERIDDRPPEIIEQELRAKLAPLLVPDARSASGQSLSPRGKTRLTEERNDTSE
jgi:hypothetical protein